MPTLQPETLKVGLIGCGRIGKVHAESVFENRRTELSVVADVMIEGAQAVTEQFGGTPTAIAQDALDPSRVDFAIIASPTPTHAELLRVAIGAGVPVLCEKPIDLDMSVVESIRDLATASKSPIALGFNRRFDPNFAEAYRRVRSGEIGDLEQVLIVSRDPAPPTSEYVRDSGGIFRDMTIHDFDLAAHFVGKFESLSALGFNHFSEDIKNQGDFDAVTVVLRAKSGVSVTITNSRHAAHGFDQRLELFGSKGMIRVENVNTTSVRVFTDRFVSAETPYESVMFIKYKDSYRLELNEFIQLLEVGKSASPGFEDGRNALLVADAAGISAREGRTVQVTY